MTNLEALTGCVAALGKIKAPTELLDEVIIPIIAVSNTLKMVIGDMREAEKNKTEKAEEKGEEEKQE